MSPPKPPVRLTEFSAAPIPCNPTLFVESDASTVHWPATVTTTNAPARVAFTVTVSLPVTFMTRDEPIVWWIRSLPIPASSIESLPFPALIVSAPSPP